ncbi:MAG: hypothetical protein GDA47_02455 [Rhodospirillales bacterium]|nr:hypothetical protein [Rhodospirillales bacterium]
MTSDGGAVTVTAGSTAAAAAALPAQAGPAGANVETGLTIQGSGAAAGL